MIKRVPGFLKLMTGIFLIGLGFRLFLALKSNLLQESSHFEAWLWGSWFDAAIAGFFGFIAILVLGFANILQLSVRLQNRIFIGLIVFYQFLLIMDFHYFQESGRHVLYEIHEFQHSFSELFKVSLSFWPSWIYLFGFTVLVSQISWVNKQPAKFKGWLMQSFKGGAGILLCLFLFRGGWVNIPIDPTQAYRLGDGSKAAIALNGAYSSIYGFLNPKILMRQKIVLPSDINPEEVLRSLYQKNENEKEISPLQPANIILLFLEGWSAYYQKSSGWKNQTTPFYDSLREKSLSAKFMLANGHRTTEGLFATMCSFQNPLGQSVAQSKLQGLKYNCLPKILREAGWSTIFFQGSGRETSGTGSFAQTLGFEKSYGKEDYIGNFKYEQNKWGIHDSDLYREVQGHLLKAKEPFFLAVNSNTTHDLTLPRGVEAKFPGIGQEERYQSVLHFADTALQDYVKDLEQTQLTLPTYLVLVADHTAYFSGDGFHHYQIPFLIYRLGGGLPAGEVASASQRDIAPTILDLLGAEAPHFTGQSLLKPGSRPSADYFHYGILGWVEADQLVEISLKAQNSPKCFNLSAQTFKKVPRACRVEDQDLFRRALSFTYFSQELLFSGATANWHKVLFDGMSSQ